ncbi:hypothetical protein CRM22_009277, partial [Opisthorchis felineus]
PRIMVRYWRHRGKEIFKRLEPHIDKYFPYHKPELDRVSGEKAFFTGKRVRAPFDLALGQVVPFGQQLTASHPEIVKVRLHKLCLNRFLLKDQGGSVFVGHFLSEELIEPSSERNDRRLRCC